MRATRSGSGSSSKIAMPAAAARWERAKSQRAAPDGYTIILGYTSTLATGSAHFQQCRVTIRARTSRRSG